MADKNDIRTALLATLNPFAAGLFGVWNMSNAVASAAQSTLNTQLVVGRVLFSAPHTYGVIVSTPTHRSGIRCVVLTTAAPTMTGIGAVTSYLPPVGSAVLVYAHPSSSVGYILGVLPVNFAASSSTTVDVAMTLGNENNYKVVPELAFTAETNKPVSAGLCGRAADLVPGNHAVVNELGAGTYVYDLLAGLRGSGGARVETFVIDDLVRIVSGQFQHFTPLGETHMFNDNGTLSLEMTTANHQCERDGKAKYEPVITDKPEKVGGMQSSVQPKGDDVSLNRFSLFLGGLGDTLQVFVHEPNGTTGRAHFGINSSGDTFLRSAGAICIQQTASIPVPVRLKQAWDPTGDKLPKLGMTKDPFIWGSDDDVNCRPLQARDMLAWHRRNTYLRFLEASTANDRKDFNLPEENLVSVTAKYEDVDGTALGTAAQPGGETTVAWLPGGGLVLREPGGAEISLIGGYVRITAPNGIILDSGADIDVLAGRSAIVRSRKSIDVASADGDVRIKAKRNMHMLSTDGGILLESDATEDTQSYKDKKGTAVVSSGVVLMAKQSRVLLHGLVIHLSSLTDMFLESLAQKTGKLIAAFQQLTLLATQQFVALAGTNGIRATTSQTHVFGKSLLMAGDTGAMITSGTKAGAIQFVDMQSNPYQDLAKSMQSGYIHNYLEQDMWLGAVYIPSKIEDIKFTYRTDDQYGLGEDTPGWVLYEAFWQYMWRTAGTTKAKTWVDTDDREGTMMWPGKDRYTKSGMKQMQSEANYKQGSGVARFIARNPQGGPFTAVGMSDYQVKYFTNEG